MNIQNRKIIAIVLYGTLALIVGVLACAQIVILAGGIEETSLGLMRLFMSISAAIILCAILFDVFASTFNKFKFASYIVAYASFLITIIFLTVSAIMSVSMVDFYPVLICNVTLGLIVYIGDKFKGCKCEGSKDEKIQKVENLGSSKPQPKVVPAEVKSEAKVEKPVAKKPASSKATTAKRKVYPKISK